MIGKHWVYGLSLCVAGCAAMTSSLPPVPEAGSGPQGTGRIVWHDLVTHDPERLQNFYGELLGWTFRDAGLGTNYRLIMNKDQPIGGLAGIPGPETGPAGAQWLGMISVVDVDTAVEQVRNLGGSVTLPPSDAGQRGRTAVIAGPNGARVGLVTLPGGEPPPVTDTVEGAWLWNELWSPAPQQVEEFYGALAGFTASVERLEGDVDYRVLFFEGEPRAGVVQTPAPDIPANWLAYVRVNDVGAIARQVQSLGGTVLLEPRKVGQFGVVAIIRDPLGGVIGVQSREVT